MTTMEEGLIFRQIEQLLVLERIVVARFEAIEKQFDELDKHLDKMGKQHDFCYRRLE